MKDQKWSLDFTIWVPCCCPRRNCQTFCCSAVLGVTFRGVKVHRGSGGATMPGIPVDLRIFKFNNGWECLMTTFSCHGNWFWIMIDLYRIWKLRKLSKAVVLKLGAMMRCYHKVAAIAVGNPKWFQFWQFSPSCTRMYHLLRLSWYDTNGVN